MFDSYSATSTDTTGGNSTANNTVYQMDSSRGTDSGADNGSSGTSGTATIYRSAYTVRSHSARMWADYERLMEFYQKHFEYPDYDPAPRKLEYISKAPKFIHKTIKQPVSRAGYKRGQRR